MSHAPEPELTQPSSAASASPAVHADDDAARRLSETTADESVSATYRTAPRMLPIVGLGAALGLLAALIAALAAPGGPDYSRASAFGYFAMLFGMVGAGLGGLTAVILDRVSLKRSSEVRLVKTDEPLNSTTDG